MTPALLYRSRHKWRFAVALFSAVAIHIGAISLAAMRHAEPKAASGFSIPDIILDSTEPMPDLPSDSPDPLPTPPVVDQLFVEPNAMPPPVHRTTRLTPVTRPRTSTIASTVQLSSAKVYAVNAPRPEYPYEARRQRITGDGTALLVIDSSSGNVVAVTMTKSTGNQFLDSAAMTGFKRWRFKPGTVSSVTCPITFTLTGASY